MELSKSLLLTAMISVTLLGYQERGAISKAQCVLLGTDLLFIQALYLILCLVFPSLFIQCVRSAKGSGAGTLDLDMFTTSHGETMSTNDRALARRISLLFQCDRFMQKISNSMRQILMLGILYQSMAQLNQQLPKAWLLLLK